VLRPDDKGSLTVHDNLEPTVLALEKQVHSKDLGLAELMHAARRVGARLLLK
jgi:hypothetical protein